MLGMETRLLELCRVQLRINSGMKNYPPKNANVIRTNLS